MKLQWGIDAKTRHRDENKNWGSNAELLWNDLKVCMCEREKKERGQY